MKSIAFLHRLAASFLLASSALLFTPPAIAFTADMTSANGSLSGLWNNAAESGWGASLIHQYGIIFATFYTYDNAGYPVWYVASSCAVSGSGCAGSLYSVSGGTGLTAQWSETNKAVTEVGTVAFTFTDANTGTMTFTINGVHGSKSITKSVFASAPSTGSGTTSCRITESGYGYADLTLQDQQTIGINITSTSNQMLFASYYYSIAQGSNSSQIMNSSSYLNDFQFEGDNGFQGGSIPSGTSKSGIITNFPSWFNPHSSFRIINGLSGGEATCSL